MTEERRGPLSWLATRGVEAVNLDEVLAGVDLDAVVSRVDVEALLDRIDVDALLDRVDVNRLLDRADVDRLLDRVEPDPLLDRVDANRLLDRVDADRLLDRVDADRLLDRVDPNKLLDRVDPNPLLDRVAADRLLDRVDPNRLTDRVDVQRLVDRVDMQQVVDRAGIADIVADSTGAVAGNVLDVARRQLVALDTIVERLAYRILRRDPDERPGTPRSIDLNPDARAKDGRAQVTGHYAGPVSRAAAFALDVFIAFWAFTAGAAALTWVAGTLGFEVPQQSGRGWVWTALFFSWAFLYWVVSLALTGRTVGKAVVGLKVVAKDGGPMAGPQALVRTLVLPLSFILLGLGVLVVLVSPRRAAMHDSVAQTCEIYDWGDRPAELPAPLTAWIDRRVGPQ